MLSFKTNQWLTRGQSDINKGNKVKMKVGRFFNGCDDGFMDLYKCQTYRSVCFNYVHFTASNYVLKCKNIFKIKICISYCLNK